MLCAICQASQNKNAHSKQCEQQPTFNLANIYFLQFQNFSNSSTNQTRPRCRHMLANSALPNGGMSRAGVHFSPEEFLQEALRLQRPTEQQSLFPKEVRTNVSYLTSKTVHQVAKERTEQVRRARVLEDKRLCLLDLLIREAGHEDLTLVDDSKRGFVFSQKFRPACPVKI